MKNNKPMPKILPMQRPVLQEIGPIKLKDSPNRGGIELDLTTVSATHVLIQKVHGQNNKLKITIYGKPEVQNGKTTKPTKKV